MTRALLITVAILLLAACASPAADLTRVADASPSPRPTLANATAQATVVAAEVAARQTELAAGAHMTAIAADMAAQAATAQADQATARARQTEIAAIGTGTAVAHASATQVALDQLAALASATHAAHDASATAQAAHATSTVVAQVAEIAQAGARATLAAIERQQARDEATDTFWTWAPLVLLFCVAVIGVSLAWRVGAAAANRMRARDNADGTTTIMVPLPGLRGLLGGVALLHPANMAGPVQVVDGEARNVDVSERAQTQIALARLFVAGQRGAPALPRSTRAGQAALPATTPANMTVLPPTVNLPALVELPDRALLPGINPFQVEIGVGERGPITFDIAARDRERALLIAGASGFGKTSAIYVILAQLVRHTSPENLTLAIVDPKGDLALFRRLAHTRWYAAGLDSTAEFLEVVRAVEAELFTRQEAFRAAGDTIGDLDEYNAVAAQRLPLVLLVVDEFANVAEEPEAMRALVRIARIGRSFGVSVIAATQNPTRDVISRHMKVNLPARLAFHVSDQAASRVILDCSGAETLGRPGRALAGLAGGTRLVQAYRVGRERLAEILAPITVAPQIAERVPTIIEASPAPQLAPHVELSEIERQLVRVSIEQLGGAFTINRLMEIFAGQISNGELRALAQSWETRGWLTPAGHDATRGVIVGRRVTPVMAMMAGIIGYNVTGVTGVTNASQASPVTQESCA